ncbi:chromosome segregation protein Csm1/Pcs1-domain-containing protein [Stachybotrys elegans]|uniref:Chromosome segregation protein Csm1/Pcs1-domain-containing protein n=1 Tax=Stachybotrys elegans TaxID=80388 RepID=A0A8K0SXF6_9HYPO|nr:chromosome segregation protein Csm1/Pcs1-domain-containing protein [Stachybotrys elegans]
MPPRGRAKAQLAGLAGSDSEPDFDSFEPMQITSARNSKPPTTATKPLRGRPPAANKVTKPATRNTRRASDPVTTAVLSPAKSALADKITMSSARPRRGAKPMANQEDDLSKPAHPYAPEEPRASVARGRPRATRSAVSTPASASKTSAIKPRRGRPPAQRTIQTIAEIPETQPPEPANNAMPQDDTMELDDHRVVSEPVLRNWTPETELDDVSMRRRLGDLMRKYDSLEMRYRDLREVGIKEAERNFERLKKQMDENAEASNELISQLREEVATQRALARRGDQAQQQLESTEDRVMELEKQVTEATTALDRARAEIKTLSTKLAAARAAEASVKAPGSALKNGAANSRNVPSEALQAAQLKEDLYGELTGLMILGYKRAAKEDVFNCLQAGANGTLHFKLSLDNPDDVEYEDAEVTYRPQLEANRDEELMSLLPDYLLEEITFPKPQASNFYNRVRKSLME